MIGILSAIELEIKPYIEAMSNKTEISLAGNTFYKGILQGKEVICACSGIGKVNAGICATLLIEHFGVTTFIFSGVAGGMKQGQRINDIVVVDKTCYHDFDNSWLKSYYPNMEEDCFTCDEKLVLAANTAAAKTVKSVQVGKAVSGDTFIVEEGRETIRQSYNPLCVDMETASAAHACYLFGVPFVAVRALSDTDDEKGIGTFEENCSSAAKQAFLVVSEMLNNI